MKSLWALWVSMVVFSVPVVVGLLVARVWRRLRRSALETRILKLLSNGGVATAKGVAEEVSRGHREVDEALQHLEHRGKVRCRWSVILDSEVYWAADAPPLSELR
jgi:hypothetical protein